jgi:hypothetical protein
MTIAKVFETRLVVSPFGDGKYWYLREPLKWVANSGNTIVVQRGFVTDFASVPRLIWWLFPPWAKYGNAAVVHDYCYWEQRMSRKEADAVILEGMKDLGVNWLTRQLIYRALRLFGSIAWWQDKRDKAANHIQVIDIWPPSATTIWKEFRKKLEMNRALADGLLKLANEIKSYRPSVGPPDPKEVQTAQNLEQAASQVLSGKVDKSWIKSLLATSGLLASAAITAVIRGVVLALLDKIP